MKSAVFRTLLVLCAFRAFGATSPDECFSLIDSFSSGVDEIEELIALYDGRLKEDPSDSGADLALAILHVARYSAHDKSRPPNRALAEEALFHASRFLGSAPDNDLGLLFSGIARSLLANEGRNPFSRMGAMKKAAIDLGRAVDAASGGLHEWYVRFMRANTYASTPRIMNKWHDAEEDYRHLSVYVAAHPEREPYLVAANYYRALMKKEAGEKEQACDCLRRSLALEDLHRTGSREAVLAARLLKDLER